MVYDRKTLLSLKLRSKIQLRKLSRTEMLTRLQLLRVVDPIIDDIWQKVEKKRWKDQTDDDPHGHPWHVSFHASQFPGDNPMACSRQAVYRMADFAPTEPFSRKSRTVMSAGKAIEVELVKTLHEGGILLSAPPDAEVQTGFEHEEAWLTGSVDCVIQPPRSQKPLPIEVKSKYDEQIDKMRTGLKGPDEAHISQLKVQLGFIRFYQETGKLWADLEPVTHGYILYHSRDRPAKTAEFRVDYDRRFFETGIARLKQWKQLFLEEVIPEVNPSKRHPMGWRWSYQPCAWCPFKDTCKADFTQKITALPESTGIRRSEKIRPHYDYAAARQRVVERWTPKKEKEKTG